METRTAPALGAKLVARLFARLRERLTPEEYDKVAAVVDELRDEQDAVLAANEIVEEARRQ